MNHPVLPADERFFLEAVMLASCCPSAEGSFSVGCLVADAQGTLICSGFSREWGPEWHAEEVAIEKARRAGVSLKGGTLYSSLEPCSVRLSGNAPCCSHIIQAGIARVVFCMLEPPIYVDCKGVETLQAAGIDVKQDATLKSLVIKYNPGRF